MSKMKDIKDIVDSENNLYDKLELISKLQKYVIKQRQEIKRDIKNAPLPKTLEELGDYTYLDALGRQFEMVDGELQKV